VPGPGEYRPDLTEGITRIEDLPKPNVSLRSRNYRRRPCPRCGHSSYRDRTARRKRRIEGKVGDLFAHRYLCVQRRLTASERVTLRRITRGLPQLRTLRALMEGSSVY
jgi:hypothetical protein